MRRILLAAGPRILPLIPIGGFAGIRLVSRSSTPRLESELRSMDNYPDTGGPAARRNLFTALNYEKVKCPTASPRFAVFNPAWLSS